MTTPAPFIISHTVSAPRSLVFEIYTQPQHLARWLSPTGFNSIYSKMDFQVGGHYHYGIEGPGSMQMWGKQEYLEIVPNQKIVYLQSFSTPEGGLGTHPMSPNWPKYMHATNTFEAAANGDTKITILWVPHESDDAGHHAFESAREGMVGGFSGTFAKLDAYLEELKSKS